MNQPVVMDVTKRPAFHAIQHGHHSCNHNTAEILRMVKNKVKEFSDEQLAAILITLEQEHKQRMALCEQ